MRPIPGVHRDESWERARARMIQETCRYIEWGLQHPEKIEWIPRHPVGRATFSERVKTVFWTLVLRNQDGPEEEA